MNESERVFKRKRKRKTKLVSYVGLQSAYIKNCGLVVQSYQTVEGSDSFFPWDDLLREYVKKNWLFEARRIFDIMPERSCISWHVIILGYMRIGHIEEARTLFETSPKAGTTIQFYSSDGFVFFSFCCHLLLLYLYYICVGMVWESMICEYARHGMSKLAYRSDVDCGAFYWQYAE